MHSDNVASNIPPEGIEAITEGQAKVNFSLTILL